MQKHNDAMKTSGHRSLEKYTSHFIERVVCERELETEQNCNILTPHSSGYHSLSFPFSWLFNRGHGGPASLGHGSHSSIFTPTNWTSCRRGYIIIWRLLFFLQASQFRTQLNPSTVKVTPDLLICSTGCTCYLHRRISSFDSLAGSEVNIQHKTLSGTTTSGESGYGSDGNEGVLCNP